MQCSFCALEIDGKAQIVLKGVYGNICENCIEEVHRIYKDKKSVRIKSQADRVKLKKPHEIKSELDKCIIGQDEAKKLLSVEVYNHYKRVRCQTETDIQKTNLMLIGPSGSGKTYLVEKLAEIMDVPLAICDATGLTEAGYVGKDVESILTSLIKKANGDVKVAEKGIVYIDEVDKLALKDATAGRIRDIGGEGVQQALLKMIEGAEIPIELNSSSMVKNQVMINTKNILFICGGAFVGINDIAKKRVNPNSRKVIGFEVPPSTETSKDEKEYIKIQPEDVVKYGFIKEFVGRVPLIATLHELTEKDLIDILVKPKNSIVKQYVELLRFDDITLNFSEDALDFIAKEAIRKGVGARGLRGIIADKLNEAMYELPAKEDVKEFTVTKEYLQS